MLRHQKGQEGHLRPRNNQATNDGGNQLTPSGETRDWEQLLKDIDVFGQVVAARKHGYKDRESMMASVRAHNRAGSGLVRRSERRLSIESIRSINTGEIPPDIEKQLLSVETLEIKELIVDHRYQRNEFSTHIRNMAEHWNWMACGPLVVSLRASTQGNQYAVIDGQQRLGALKLLGYAEAPCRIYMDLSTEQEAELYELLNRSKNIGYNDMFKSRLSRGDETANSIRIGVEQSGYHLDPERRHAGRSLTRTGHFYIQSMVELERIFKSGGITHLMDVLKFMKGTWSPEPLGAQQKVLAGISLFMKTYPDADLSELSEKLRRQGITKTLQNSVQWQAVHGRSGGTGGAYGRAFCEAMLACYNDRRQEANRIRSKLV